MKKSELIINPDGGVYHLHLLPGDIAKKIILVGDPGRVDLLADLLTNIRVDKQNREFHTITGEYGLEEISIISTGIGTDNIDIVMNELDALFNVDLSTNEPKKELTRLTIVRLGTCGAINSEIPVGSTIISEVAIGFDSLLHFYGDYEWVLEPALTNELTEYLEWPDMLSYPYAVKADKELFMQMFDESYYHGITISTPGFYAPQGRSIRLKTFDDEINDMLSNFDRFDIKICNYEMESSAIYGLSKLLGHKAVTLCVAIANRATGDFLSDYQPAVYELAKRIMDQI